MRDTRLGDKERGLLRVRPTDPSATACHRGQVIARVARRAVSCIGARPTGGALRGGGANGSLGEAHCARGRAQCKASVARRAKRRIGAGTDGGTRRSRGASCSPRWEQNTKNKAEYSVQLRVE